jgi:hypothetical protein
MVMLTQACYINKKNSFENELVFVIWKLAVINYYDINHGCL